MTEKETPNASNLGAKEALFHGGFGSFKPSPPPFCCFSGCYMKGSEVGENGGMEEEKVERERETVYLYENLAGSLSPYSGWC